MQVDSATGVKRLSAMMSGMAHRHATYQVFSDFVEAAALSISNAVDLPQYEKREARYMELIKRYDAKVSIHAPITGRTTTQGYQTTEKVVNELAVFPQMLAELTDSLENEMADVLGRTYHELELHNKWAGQYFTPYEFCRMMAKMTIGDNVQERIAARGFITLQEPACGSGAMVIAFAQEMKDAGFSYQQQLHVTTIDIDAKCCHMAYIQLSLLHIPAIIIHGNTLSLEEYGRWYTPAHIMGGWDHRLNRPEIQPAETSADESWDFLNECLEEPVVQYPVLSNAPNQQGAKV